MIVEQSRQIIAEVNKAFIGKNEIVEKVLMTIYAGGHVLLEDCPGVGKTTLAVTFSKVLGLSHKRIQFTTDTLPSDITGFNMFNRETNQFEYRDGAANCQLLLADEINRTSPKTQSAQRICCRNRSSASQHRTRSVLPEHSRCRNPSWTVSWSAFPSAIRAWKTR